jgi:CheY-like chemotaxis protein
MTAAEYLADKRIIYLDNEATSLETVKRIFHDRGVKDVSVHKQPLEAINLVLSTMDDAERRFDIFISDMNMPEKNGVDLLSYIRKESDQITLILYTGFVVPQRSGHEQQCADAAIFIQKKLDDPEDFVLSVAMNHHRHQKNSPGGIKGNNIHRTIDPRNFEEPPPAPTAQIVPASDMQKMEALKMLAKPLMDDLARITDKKAVVVTGDEHITVAQLIKEIDGLSTIGLEHLSEWFALQQWQHGVRRAKETARGQN